MLIENREYRRRRQVNLRLSFAGLLLGPLVCHFVMGIAQSTIVLNWVPFVPWIHTAHDWIVQVIQTLAYVVSAQVMTMQVLVWWVWKPRHPLGRRSTHSLIGIGLLVARIAGSTMGWLGLLLSNQLLNGGDINQFWDAIAAFTVGSLWVTILFAAHWLMLRAAQPIIAVHMVDTTVGTDRGKLHNKGSWSIRGIKTATLVFALMIISYQWLMSYWQSTVGGGAGTVSGVSTVVSIAVDGIVQVLILYAAARYVAVGSILVGFAILIIVWATSLARTLAFIGASMPFTFDMLVLPAILYAMTCGLHIWLFRFWERAGYKLRLSA